MTFLDRQGVQKGVCRGECPVRRPDGIGPARFDQLAFLPLKLLRQNLNEPNPIEPGQPLDFRQYLAQGHVYLHHIQARFQIRFPIRIITLYPSHECPASGAVAPSTWHPRLTLLLILGGLLLGKVLQVVKVFVAAGGLLQFAQPAQGNKSQVVELDAVGKNVGYRHIRKAGDVVV